MPALLHPTLPLHLPLCSTAGEWECRACMPLAAPSACGGGSIAAQKSSTQQMCPDHGKAVAAKVTAPPVFRLIQTYQLQSARPRQLRCQCWAACCRMQHVGQRATCAVLCMQGATDSVGRAPYMVQAGAAAAQLAVQTTKG